MLHMKGQDLVEPYQLLHLYERTCGGGEAAGKLPAEVGGRYRSAYGENICKKRNPRQAGRTKRYTQEIKGEVRKLRGESRTIRETAKETGCPVGYVQGVLKEP